MDTRQTAVIVGLGNPGAQYRDNRHNVGFMVLEALAARLELGFTDRTEAWQAASGQHIVLIKPMTYMNRSGEALGAWARSGPTLLTGRPSLPPEAPGGTAEAAPELVPEAAVELPSGIRPLVVCDDLALPLGSVRLRGRGSSGGQNGLASVIEHLGGSEFPRLRLGIAPLSGAVPPAEWPDYVLADFTPAEAEPLAEMVSHAVAALEFWLAEGLEATVSRFNRRVRPSE